MQNTLAPLPPTSKSGTVGGDIVLMRVLSVLASLLRDLATLQARRKAASLDPSLISVCTPLHITSRTALTLSPSFSLPLPPSPSLSLPLPPSTYTGTTPGCGTSQSGEDMESLHPPHTQVSLYIPLTLK